MAQTFPATLQDKLNVSGFTFGLGNTTTRSSMDVGPAKVRRRFTTPIDQVSSTITIDYDDWSILYDFYNTTLAGGSLTFLYDHPMTGVETEFRFVQPPTASPMGGRTFSVSFTWEIV